MKIALDYDDTYTADPQLWDAFITAAKQRGHSVTIVTKREPVLGVEVLQEMEVIFTSRKAKHSFMPAGTIWIEDSPQGIFVDG